MRPKHFLPLITIAAALLAATPKEAVGFRGKVTGVVKSARADGASFVLKITSAEPEEKSTVKDGSSVVGKEITLGVRQPKKDGKAYPHPDDIAYIKTLKPGATISVKIFAVFSDPTVVRIQGPGEAAAPAAAKDEPNRTTPAE